jgi:hypothetical protein
MAQKLRGGSIRRGTWRGGRVRLELLRLAYLLLLLLQTGCHKPMTRAFAMMRRNTQVASRSYVGHQGFGFGYVWYTLVHKCTEPGALGHTRPQYVYTNCTHFGRIPYACHFLSTLSTSGQLKPRCWGLVQAVI